jgi:aspartate racemase
MKRIGLLGGMSWESSAEYYRLVNEATRDRLGGLHSADCLLRSVDFAEIEQMQRAGDWERAGAVLAAEAAALEAAGAELLVLCTNTMHKLADAITAAIAIPFVHIADTTADAVHGHGLATVGLLATAYTMEQDFYVGRLRDVHGLEVLVPGEADRRIVHDVIYQELCVGVVADDSREEYRRIIRGLADRGAEGILLGCTEIDLLIGPQDAAIPVFDTTRLHAQRAVDLALTGDEPSGSPTAHAADGTDGATDQAPPRRTRASSPGHSRPRASRAPGYPAANGPPSLGDGE